MKRIMWSLVIVLALVTARVATAERPNATDNSPQNAPGASGYQNQYTVPAQTDPGMTTPTTTDQSSQSQSGTGSTDQEQSGSSMQSSPGSSDQTGSGSTDQSSTPSSTDQSSSSSSSSSMPKTASPLPLIGLTGLVALAGGLVLTLRRKPA